MAASLYGTLRSTATHQQLSARNSATTPTAPQAGALQRGRHHAPPAAGPDAREGLRLVTESISLSVNRTPVQRSLRGSDSDTHPAVIVERHARWWPAGGRLRP